MGPEALICKGMRDALRSGMQGRYSSAIFRDAVLKERHHGTHMFGSSEVAMNNHPYVKRNNTFPAGAKRPQGDGPVVPFESGTGPLCR